MDEQQSTQPGRNGGTLKRGNNPKKEGSVSIVTALKRVLAEGSTAEDLARALVANFKEGNGAAIKAVLDRIDGPVATEIDADVRVVVEFADFKAYADAEDNPSDAA